MDLNELIELVNDVAELDSVNTLASNELEEWITRALAMYRDEVLNFPEIKEEGCWDVIIADVDKSKPCLFASMYMNESNTDVEFLVGLGEYDTLRDFTLEVRPAPGLAHNEMMNRFRGTRSCKVEGVALDF